MAKGKYEHYIKEWTEMYESGVSMRKIADQYDVSKGTVQNNLKKRGVEVRPKRLYGDRVDKWVKMYQTEDRSLAEISKMEGVKAGVIKKYLSEVIELRAYPYKTQEKKYEHLKEEWIAEYESGKSLGEIGKIYGVHAQTVHNYLSVEIDMRTYSEASRKYAIDESAFDEIDTKEKAYWLGLIFSTGSLLKSPDTKGFNLYLRECHKDMLLKFRDTVLKSDKPLDFNSDDRIYYLRIGNEHLFNTLYEYGLRMKKTKFSEFPRHLETKYLKSFILGYMDGKGAISYRSESGKTERYIVHVYGPNGFLKEMKSFLEAAVGVQNIKQNEEHSYLALYSQTEITNFVQWLYEEEGTFVVENRMKYMRILG